MAEDKKQQLTLTDADIITSPRITRRTLLAGAGVALGTVAIAGRSAMAGEKDEGEADKGEADKGEADKDDGEDKDKADADAASDDGEDKDKADAEVDKGDAERDAD
jgi:hypothetical protein